MADFKFARISVRAFFALAVLISAIIFSWKTITSEPKAVKSEKKDRASLVAASDFLKNSKTAVDQSGNVTEQLMKTYNQEVVRLNQKIAGKNPTLAAVKLPDADYVEQILEKPTSEELQIPEFKEEDLKINKNATEKDVDDYLEKFFGAIQKNESAFKTPYVTAVAKAAQNNDNKDLKNHIEVARKIVSGFLEIDVPEVFRFFHLKNLNIWQARISIGETILNENDDPIKAIMAVNSIEKLTARENAMMNAIDELIKTQETNNG